MSFKTYVVHSVTLDDRWIVKAGSVKDAIIETLTYLHSRLRALESKAEKNIDLELKVSELKSTVTSIRNMNNEQH